ncbi:MAG: DNA translocase FtsK [Anaeroplasmataceae bacterium]
MKIKKMQKINTVGFRIPQVEEDLDGLKYGKSNFKPSSAGSPLFGTNVKDTFLVNDIGEKVDMDVRKNYDFARTEKKISKAELIEKYGTEFYEFQTITSEKRKKVYGSDITINNTKDENEEVKQEENIGFNFIKNAQDFIDGDSEDVSFDFDQFNTFDEENEEDNETDLDLSFGTFKPKYESESVSYSKEDHTTVIRTGRNNDFLKKEEDVTPSPSYKEENVVRTTDFNGVTPSFEHKTEESKVFELPKSVNPYRDYKLPPRDIFRKGSASDTELPQWVYDKEEIINQTLMDFGVEGTVEKRTKGPTFCRFEIALASGVPVKKIISLHDNLQMNLGAKSIRIQAPIPGKKTVGIEVPNAKVETVFFGDIINDEFYEGDNPLKIALGKDIDNNSIYTKINKWPHGLIAGSTGSGKSVCMNTILISLLLRNKPDEVKLLLVDPKTVELMSYNDLPHLVTPVINDPILASQALKWACEEMDRRYMYLSKNHVRNIEDYNKKALSNPEMQKLCYIVIVIDELADLMMTASSDVEESIMRITAKARAAGIHLLIATQRPTVDVVKGTIKANIATRVAFHTVSPVDSITILDEAGAEELLGKGDMFLKEGDIPMRLQGAYIPDEEIDAVTDFIRAQAEPNYLFTHDDLKKNMTTVNATGTQSQNESPEMLYNAALYFIEQESCSINGLQQQFQLGFNRAAKIVAALEEMGIVSGKNGTKGREVLVNVAQLNEIFERGE